MTVSMETCVAIRVYCTCSVW